MRKLSLFILVVLAAASVAMAAEGLTQSTTDVLGAHNGYGRGCVMCHAPHSGAAGNNVASNDPQNGMYALWGQDLTPLYGKTYNFSGDGAAKYPVTLPAEAAIVAPATTYSGGISSAHDANTIILFCLSCHDGVTAVVGMMKGQTVETLPVVGGTAPTLLAKAAPAAGAAYNNDHPVGGSAYVSCNGSSGGGAVTTASESGYNWDCTGGGNTTTPITPGTNQLLFMQNYKSSFWNNTSSGKQSNPLSTFGGTVNAVTCTTCHDQHSMTVYTNSNGAFDTSFFVRGWYKQNNGGNAVAQFCRNCHGGESNEMHGQTGVPTT